MGLSHAKSKQRMHKRKHKHSLPQSFDLNKT